MVGLGCSVVSVFLGEGSRSSFLLVTLSCRGTGFPAPREGGGRLGSLVGYWAKVLSFLVIMSYGSS